LSVIAVAVALAVPTSATAGFGYATDSTTMTISGSAPGQEPVIGGACGAYFGKIGNWEQLEQCPLAEWSAINAVEANPNTTLIVTFQRPDPHAPESRRVFPRRPMNPNNQAISRARAARGHRRAPKRNPRSPPPGVANRKNREAPPAPASQLLLSRIRGSTGDRYNDARDFRTRTNRAVGNAGLVPSQ